MPVRPIGLRLPRVLSDTAQSAKRSRLEDEVVALFDEFRDCLLRYLLTFGLTVADSEELVQEAFLSLFQHLRREKSRANLRGWLFQVAHNLALKRRERLRRGAAPFDGSAEEHLAVDPAPTPEDQVLRGELQQRLLSVVGALPEVDRNCLSLRAEGLRYREIADVLNISLGAVSISLTRSLARLARVAER
jgi:RNA polymerase sigma-70 factor (ECF subfamily)